MSVRVARRQSPWARASRQGRQSFFLASSVTKMRRMCIRCIASGNLATLRSVAVESPFFAALPATPNPVDSVAHARPPAAARAVVALAQSAEHRNVDPKVAGSRPAGHPTPLRDRWRPRPWLPESGPTP